MYTSANHKYYIMTPEGVFMIMMYTYKSQVLIPPALPTLTVLLQLKYCA